jgi:hypothetical protein
VTQPEDPAAKARRDIARQTGRLAFLYGLEVWMWVLLVGVPVLAICGCCGYFLVM